MTLPADVVSAFPSLRPPWPAQLTPSGIGTPRWGLWDHEIGEVVAVDPGDDHRLPGLRDWVARGQLLAYRPGWRAVVRVEVTEVEPGDPFPGPRWVHLVRPNRVAELVDRHRAMAHVTHRLRGPMRVPEIVEVDPDHGAVVLSAVAGTPLRDLLAGPGADDALVAVGQAVARYADPSVVAALVGADGGPPPRAAVARRAPDWASLAGAAAGDPAIARRLEDLVPRLVGDTGADLPRVVVHGDLHDRNVFLDPVAAESAGRLPGEVVPLVGTTDLDAAGLGEPGRDIAGLACHVELQAMLDDAPTRGEVQSRLLLDAYTVAGGGAPADVIRAWQARTWFRLACVHLFRRDSGALWERLLARVAA